MRTTLAVIAPTSVRLEFNLMSQLFPTTVTVEGFVYVAIGPTSNVFYPIITPPTLVKYTIDVNGLINITDINLYLKTRNNSNSNSKLQISGDGGTTWVDMTDDIPGNDTDYERKGSGLWISSVQVGTDMLRIRFLTRSVDGTPAFAQFGSDSTITIIYNKLITGTTPTPPSFPTIIGRGFVVGGRCCNSGSAANVGTNERFDDVTNAWTGRTGITARRGLAGYGFTLSDFGFSSGGFTAAVVTTTERFDDVANTNTGVLALNTARSSLAGFSLAIPPKQDPDRYGFTACGIPNGGDSNAIERYDNVANTQTPRANGTARRFPIGYGMFGAGFTSCGNIIATPATTGTTERLNDVTNLWTLRTAATARFGPAGYSISELGIDPAYSDIHPFGFSSGGVLTQLAADTTGLTERFDDFTNVHTTRAAISPRYRLTGFSMIGLGFTSCGLNSINDSVNTTEKFDDAANSVTARTGPSVRDSPGGFSLEESLINYTGP